MEHGTLRLRGNNEETTGRQLLSSALHLVAHWSLWGLGVFPLALMVAVAHALLLILANENDGGGCWLAALLRWF